MGQVYTLSEAALKAGTTVVDLAAYKAGLKAQRFDMDATRARFDAAVKQHFDAAEGVHPYELLTQVERRVVEQIYAPLEGMMVVPIENDLSLHSKRLKYFRSEGSGEAAVISGPTGLQGVPMATLGREEIEEKVLTFAVAYAIDFEELAAASPSDRADLLEDMLDGASMAKRILDTTLDKHMLISTLSGMRGLLDDSKVERQQITAITENSDPDADLRTLLSMLSAVVTASKNAIRPNKLALSLKTREIIATKHRTNTDATVLQRLVEASPYLASADDVIGLHRLDDRPVPTSNNTLTEALAFNYDPMVVRAKVLPPQQWKIMDLAFGRAVVWMCKASPVQWKLPIGGRTFFWANAA